MIRNLELFKTISNDDTIPNDPYLTSTVTMMTDLTHINDSNGLKYFDGQMYQYDVETRTDIPVSIESNFGFGFCLGF